MRKLFAVAVFGLISSLGAAGLAIAQETLPLPTGVPILTISGAIGATNQDGVAILDFETLAALPSVTVRTATPWTEGVQTFEGVSLATLMELVGAQGTTVSAVAINDYAVDIPMTDAVPGRALVAMRLNGQPMSVREKGPLWVVYPYDSNDIFRSEVIYGRSIWQLDRMEVRP